MVLLASVMATGVLAASLPDGDEVFPMTIASGSEANEMGSGEQKMAVMPPPRDPEIAVREEYDLAVRAATAEALELFIARHSDHPLAEKARVLLERLKAEAR